MSASGSIAATHFFRALLTLPPARADWLVPPIPTLSFGTGYFVNSAEKVARDSRVAGAAGTVFRTP